MASIAAATPKAYLAELPPDRRTAISAVRTMILEHLPKGYRESMNRGMLCYEVPLERYPDTYNGQPLCYVALAWQKQYCSLYLMGVYRDPALEAELKAAFNSSRRCRLKHSSSSPRRSTGDRVRERVRSRGLLGFHHVLRGVAGAGDAPRAHAPRQADPPVARDRRRAHAALLRRRATCWCRGIPSSGSTLPGASKDTVPSGSAGA